MPTWRDLGIAAAVVGGTAALAVGLALPALAALVLGGAAGIALAVATGGARAGGEAVAPAGAHAAPPGATGSPAGATGSPPGGLIARIPSPLLVIGPTGRIAYANPAALRTLPRLQEGAHFASLIRAPAFVEAVSATLVDSGERSLEFATREGAAERVFDARVGLLPPDAGFGREGHALVLIEDRTEARRVEQLRTDFIANASHELRTPLASVLGYIETLQNHAKDDPAARERFLAIMAREAGRMRRLVDDLMSLSRIEMSEHLRPAAAVSLNAIAAETAAAAAPLAEREGVTLRVELAPEGATVLGDRDQLAQVFANLVDNAVKYAGPGSTVRVLAAEASPAQPGRHGVCVADDGPGIPREHLQRLTERFYRVNAAASRAKGGTGLGLAIVKHILNRHQGRIEIASTPGKGAAFTVWLPRAETAAD
ncbi:ATP-binding protein [Amaricoccus sp.]|uniref:sensor histidine kinase n=1 Tax=Amaricoccus sp. TaxID=1872485 RepID=UPI001B3F731E|nr:ATP-binding protein [Amaricoccus sp.]MBP7000042.1 PAS domain-containing protein [Amaricoccus sp.]